MIQLLLAFLFISKRVWCPRLQPPNPLFAQRLPPSSYSSTRAHHALFLDHDPCTFAALSGSWLSIPPLNHTRRVFRGTLHIHGMQGVSYQNTAPHIRVSITLNIPPPTRPLSQHTFAVHQHKRGPQTGSTLLLFAHHTAFASSQLSVPFFPLFMHRALSPLTTYSLTYALMANPASVSKLAP